MFLKLLLTKLRISCCNSRVVPLNWTFSTLTTCRRDVVAWSIGSVVRVLYPVRGCFSFSLRGGLLCFQIVLVVRIESIW